MTTITDQQVVNNKKTINVSSVLRLQEYVSWTHSTFLKIDIKRLARIIEINFGDFLDDLLNVIKLSLLSNETICLHEYGRNNETTHFNLPLAPQNPTGEKYNYILLSISLLFHKHITTIDHYLPRFIWIE
ncbi:hypothetical protein ACJX0J_029220, partial [Zea mays]